MHMAGVVPKKGESVDFIAQRVLAFLDEMGYANSPVLLKTDQEPSIVDFVNNLIGLRASITTFVENSLVGASASNGVMERGSPGPGGHDPCLERCAPAGVSSSIRITRSSLGSPSTQQSC